MIVEQKPFRIPTAFTMFGQRIEVQYDPTLIYTEDANGTSRYRENIIHIQPSCERIPRAQTSVERTFFHELMHWTLYSIGMSKLDDDEQFVDLCAQVLHQAFTTMEYAPDADA